MPLEAPASGGASPELLREAVLAGTVVHRRNFDVQHGFTYPVWMALASLPSGRSQAGTLSRWLRPRWSKYLSWERLEALIDTPLQRDTYSIWLLTQPSMVGRSFNPVSFYFVTSEQQICWIVAHITNTPWDEDHCYVLAQEGSEGSDSWTFDKTFHVSPFMPMGLRYNWRFRVAAERIDIDMHLFKQSQRVFFATLNLKPQPTSKWLGLKLRLTYPLQNLRTLARIYYQAARLKLKGAQFYAHPDSSSIR